MGFLAVLVSSTQLSLWNLYIKPTPVYPRPKLKKQKIDITSDTLSSILYLPVCACISEN